MNGRLDKVAMTNKLMQLKRELHYKCEIGEKGEWECNGANEYQEIGEYADDAFEAVRHAREDVPYLQEHPFSLESIKKEE